MLYTVGRLLKHQNWTLKVGSFCHFLRANSIALVHILEDFIPQPLLLIDITFPSRHLKQILVDAFDGVSPLLVCSMCVLWMSLQGLFQFPQLFHSSPLFRSRYEGTLLQIQIPRRTRRAGAVAQRVCAPFQQQRQTAGGAPNGREKETRSIHVQTCIKEQLKFVPVQPVMLISPTVPLEIPTVINH